MRRQHLRGFPFASHGTGSCSTLDVSAGGGHAEAHHNLAVVYATQKPPFTALAKFHYEKALAAGHKKNADLEKILSAEK